VGRRPLWPGAAQAKSATHTDVRRALYENV
jgi:hypothetical protein